jgi:hypothetical protein
MILCSGCSVVISRDASKLEAKADSGGGEKRKWQKIKNNILIKKSKKCQSKRVCR